MEPHSRCRPIKKFTDRPTALKRIWDAIQVLEPVRPPTDGPSSEDDRTGVSDMVMNEVGGTAMTIGFQWLDKHLQKRIESHVQNRAVIAATRMLTYPPQSLANIVRFRAPWYRDNR
jgi:hypothetical protein